MKSLTPLSPSEASDKVKETYGRIAELFGTSEPPTPFLLLGHVPAFLHDFYMNFKRFVASDSKVDTKSKALIALAVCVHAKGSAWRDFYAERARQAEATEQEILDAIAIAATCAMYNTFFKFRDISGSDVFSGMSVGLRAHTFSATSLSSVTVELINIAISDLNGCKPCVSGHVDAARKNGISDEAILETIQVAATVYAGVYFTNAAG